MGGFTVNGCGATDSFYPMKDIGRFSCPHCRESRMLSLMEVKRKIRVIYIPTVSISTKYAVACAVCKNGYYISEQQKDDILYDRAEVEVTSEGLAIRKKVRQEIIDIQETDREKPQERNPAYIEENREKQQNKISGPAPVRKFCGRCGSRLDERTGLCPSCDRESVQEEEGQKNAVQENPVQANAVQKNEVRENTVQGLSGRRNRKICPVCGLIYASEKDVCGVCGSALVERK